MCVCVWLGFKYAFVHCTILSLEKCNLYREKLRTLCAKTDEEERVTAVKEQKKIYIKNK